MKITTSPPCQEGHSAGEARGEASKHPHASSNAAGWPKMALREGVPRTRPENHDFLGFCVFADLADSLPPHALSNAVGWPSCPSGLPPLRVAWR